MAPSAQVQRAQAAVKAMKLIGFDEGVAKKVLKKLLKVYDNNWEYIEAENYRLLADTILDDQESIDPETIDKTPAAIEEIDFSQKRFRREQEYPSASRSLTVPYASDGTLPKRPKLVASVKGLSANLSCKVIESAETQCSYGRGSSLSSQALVKYRTNGATGGIAPQHSDNIEGHSPTSGFVVPMMTSFTNNSHEMYFETRNSGLDLRHHIAKRQIDGKLINPVVYKEPKMEPDAELPPGTSNGSTHAQMLATLQNKNDAGSLQVSEQKESMSDVTGTQEKFSTNIDIASSSMGEVKLSLTCTSDFPDFKLQNIESIFKIVEDRCLKSYKVLIPNFSLVNLMKEICQCAEDLTAESRKDPKKSTPLLEHFSNSPSPALHHGVTRSSSSGSRDAVALEIPSPNTDGLRESRGSLESSHSMDVFPTDNMETSVPVSLCSNVSQSLAVIAQQEHAVVPFCSLHDENDITKGEETVKISFINEFNSEKFPPYFHYIPQNVVYQNAHVNFSLARIGDEDCCLNCFGDCLTAPIPCACTRETGGAFVYAQDGLLKKEYLNECISMNRYPDKHHRVYCKDCPIEKSKNELEPDACKGHLFRKFIKECWIKCGCNKQCGNRVVQRGISRNLQVFYTADGKGWGLRTLEELPRGAFVCEYVGEILTNLELYDRTIQRTGNEKHTYPVLLDADWGSEAGLRDEEALCLDATFYGNVGRFVNHRCFDANLVEVPVEWETPDHHYYHLAFFTTRKVEALEELTWDYGIDFEDHTHPIKAFKCCCGSRYCRDCHRSKIRKRSSASK
ncbi:hypothetical protein HPP92_025525 [Vanilla planifolia]|uniref:SET domain-containing protein n=1 Tax=Vanilla planifolia TaxID=51239 RepID=A0A835PI23_VANPL|nr:hypothetical protein HPP92_025525 [Vanilla planifolia]